MSILRELGCSKEFCDVMLAIPDNIKKIEAIDNDSLRDIKRAEDYHKDSDGLTGEANANIGRNMHPSAKHGKVYEPHEKIYSYHLMHKTLAEKHGYDKAGELLKEVIMGSLAINDSGGFEIPYCVAFSSSFLMKEGRSYIKDIPNTAPTSSVSYMNMATEAMYDASAEFAGATVVFDLFINLAYYTKNERLVKQKAFSGLDYEVAVSLLASDIVTSKRNEMQSITEILNNSSSVKEAVDYVVDYKVRNIFQSWVYMLGNKFRKGYQSIFSNINLFSPRVLKDNFSYHEYPNGDKMVDYIDEITKIQLVFSEFFSKGIKGNGITKIVAMPVVTLMIPSDNIGSEDLMQDDEIFMKQVISDFSNYHNLNVFKGLRLALCCRISVDKPSHGVSVNSLGVKTGGSGYDAVGSLRVVTVALPNVAQELIADIPAFNEMSLDERKNLYLSALNDKLDKATDILEAQRSVVYKKHSEGFYSLPRVGWVNLENMASTYGGVGVYEACKLVFKNEYGTAYTEEELDFGNDIMSVIDSKCVESTNKYGNPYNMECAIPAESLAMRFRDRDVILRGEDQVPYKELSNQLTPLTLKVDMVEKLKNEQKLSSVIPPSGICHINIDGKTSPEQSYALHKSIWDNYPNIEHYAFNCAIKTCANGHAEPTDHDGKCVSCDAPIVSTTTRSIGYFKCVETDFGKGRQDEFKRREFTKL